MVLAEAVAGATDAAHRTLTGTSDPAQGIGGSFKRDLPQENGLEGNSGDSEQVRRLDGAGEAASPGYNIPVLSNRGGEMGSDTRQNFSGMLADNGQSIYDTAGYEFPQQSVYCPQLQGPYVSNVGSGTTWYCGPDYGAYYQQMCLGPMFYHPSEQEAYKPGVKKLNVKGSAQNGKAKPGGPGKPGHQAAAPKSVLPDSSGQWGLCPGNVNDAYYGHALGYDCYVPQQWAASRGYQSMPPPQNNGVLSKGNLPLPDGGPGRFQNFPRVNSSLDISGKAIKSCSVKSGLAAGSNWKTKYVSKAQGKGDGALYGHVRDACPDLMHKTLPVKPNILLFQEAEITPYQLSCIAYQNCSSASTSDYNKEDFQVSCQAAKFFIIKSYSEDDVHKSIKYSVWSSTPNGNKRLDETYRKSQEKSELLSASCPVFFFFSVNCSGQFCGVAEMVGPVDFGKNMDFWLQGKWNGCLPVKWHIIKDVPNGHFRHIILSNNDNKPVTHSRDTQEVFLHEGLEMLKIFKFFAIRTSLLDDFGFYDARQRVLLERKSRQQSHQQVGKQIKEKAFEQPRPVGDGSVESRTDCSITLKVVERTSNEDAISPNEVKENSRCVDLGAVKPKVDSTAQKVADLKLDDKSDKVLKTKDANLQVSVVELEVASKANVIDNETGEKNPIIIAKAVEVPCGAADQSEPKMANAESPEMVGKEDTKRLIINYKKALLEGV